MDRRQPPRRATSAQAPARTPNKVGTVVPPTVGINSIFTAVIPMDSAIGASDGTVTQESNAQRKCLSQIERIGHGFALPAQTPIAMAKASPSLKRQLKFQEIVESIQQVEPGNGDRGYMHSILCQVGLPHSEVSETMFERRSGDASVLIEAGKLWDGQRFALQPIPYGAMPRLILAWINTYAVRNKTTEIPIGRSAKEFLMLLGKKSNGGERGNLTTLRKQLPALAACRMTLGFNTNGVPHTLTSQPVKHFEAWSPPCDGQRSLWPRSLTLSEDYYQTLRAHAVPLDMRAFMALKGSALALDVYAWLAQRLYRIEGRGFILHWKSLRDQFGQTYQGNDPIGNFKDKFKTALRDVLLVYPQAKVKVVRGGILLMTSPPPIARKA